MLQKSITAIIASYVALLLLDNAECFNFDIERVNGVNLSCWPFPVEPIDFEVSFYFSSQSKRSVLLTTETRIGVEIDFDPNRRTAVIVHGYWSNAHVDNMATLREALLYREDMNVIVLDWKNGAVNFAYPQAAANTKKAAAWIKSLITLLAQNIKTPFAKWKPVHLIGFSLGAHVVGQVGALLKKHNMIVDRITGLDPAEPCFDEPSLELRLKKSDARFVDVIHTDAARWKSERFGLRDALGHADFYVNGGSEQPGCVALSLDENTMKKIEMINPDPPKNTEEITQFVVDTLNHVLKGGICHHERSVLLFIHSIIQAAKNPRCQLWGHPWSLDTTELETSRRIREPCNEQNCVEMGINAEKYRNRPEASYYVKTTETPPFCLQQH